MSAPRASLRFSPGLVVAAIVALALGVPVRGAAQYSTLLAERSGVPLPSSVSTLRLDSMGGLLLVVPDENTEYNLIDFAGNPAGIAADKDRWSLDSWFGRWKNSTDFNSTFAGSGVRQRAAIQQDFGVSEAIYRSGGRFAIGGGVQWAGHRASIRYGDERRSRGPAMRGVVAYRVADFDFGLDVLGWSDNEDLVTTDVFAVRHRTNAWLTTLGVGSDLLGLRLGAQARFDAVTIRGKSRDAAGFHQDDFEWRRPTTNARLTLLLPRRSPEQRLEVGVNIDLLSRNGTEEAEISWSDRFPDNPSRFGYERLVPTFDEQEQGSGVSGRARFAVSPLLHIAASGSVEEFTSEVVEAVNFVGSRRAEDLEQTRTTLRGGVGYLFPSRVLQVGVEAGFRSGNDRRILARSTSDVDQRSVDAAVGVEWLIRPELALRGGYQRAGIDEDLDLPESYRTANGFTFGVGYLPRGGIFSLDAGMRVRNERPSESTGVNRRTDLFDFALATRFLF